jgi:hypothetical protein
LLVCVSLPFDMLSVASLSALLFSLWLCERFYGLDPSNPAVLAFVRDTIVTATREWGFRYLKLDFLYAAALGTQHALFSLFIDYACVCVVSSLTFLSFTPLGTAQQSYHDRSLSRAQAMRRGLTAVRSAASLSQGPEDEPGDATRYMTQPADEWIIIQYINTYMCIYAILRRGVYILGCGAPLGSGGWPLVSMIAS